MVWALMGWTSWAGQGHARLVGQGGLCQSRPGWALRRARLGWQAGNAFTGDPPSELQGSYSVYSTDTSTCEVIQKYAAAINSPAGSRP